MRVGKMFLSSSSTVASRMGLVETNEVISVHPVRKNPPFFVDLMIPTNKQGTSIPMKAFEVTTEGKIVV